MGTFQEIQMMTRPRAGRSVTTATLTTKPINQTDFRLLERTLARAGLLSAGSHRAAVASALRSSFDKPPQQLDDTRFRVMQMEMVYRRALAADAARRPGWQDIIVRPSHAMALILTSRANAKSSERSKAEGQTGILPNDDETGLTGPYRSALLPTISPETFQANRRIVEVLASGEQISDLDRLIAARLTTGGKQAFSDLRDFFGVLDKTDSDLAHALSQRVRPHLDRKRKRLFQHLRQNSRVTENDFR